MPVTCTFPPTTFLIANFKCCLPVQLHFLRKAEIHMPVATKRYNLYGRLPMASVENEQRGVTTLHPGPSTFARASRTGAYLKRTLSTGFSMTASAMRAHARTNKKTAARAIAFPSRTGL